MAGVGEPEIHREVEDPKLDLPVETHDDSDSGQGSCETDSPGLSRKAMAPLNDRDSDEEIFVSKKPKGKKVLQDSDSEEDDRGSSLEKRDLVSIQGVSEEEEKENVYAENTRRARRIFQALADSDESDPGEPLRQENFEPSVKSGSANDASELGSPPEKSLDLPGVGKRKSRKARRNIQEAAGGRVKGKSKRRLEKEAKKMETVRKLKKKETKKEEKNGKPQLNDSGCLLADKDLFETGLEEENDSPLEDEESLDSIRAAMRDKLKKHQNKELNFEGELPLAEESESSFKGPKRKERKAAKLSKEAMKRLHSETQRLVRESSLSLPYHMPENKTIHDFFKRRPRPACQGNAMALLKSAQYLPGLSEEVSEAKNASESRPDNQASGPNQENDRGSEADSSQSPSLSRVSEVTPSVDEPASEDPVVGSHEEQRQSDDVVVPGADPAGQRKSSSDSTGDSEPAQAGGAAGKEGPKDSERGGGEPEGAGLQTPVMLPVAPPKVRKFTRDKLQQLGVDLSIKPRLGADEDSYVTLEGPEVNRELEALKERFWKHTHPTTKPTAERKVNLSIIVKEAGADGKEELKADVVPVTLATENLDGQVQGKPGEKLQVLKAKLQEAMKLRRLEERQKRQALFKLDNEDGFEEEEEEEEEMTDESEEEEAAAAAEEEEEEEEEANQEMAEFLLGDEEAEDKVGEEEDKDTFQSTLNSSREVGSSIDCGSVPKPATSESTLLLFKDNSSKMGYSAEEKCETSEGSGKRSSKLEDDSCSLPTKESSHNSSFELIGSMIPCYQPCNKQPGRAGFLPAMGGFRSPSPGFFRTSFISSASKSSGKLSEPSLPIEDSQDLYTASPEPKTLFLGAGDSQFQFCLEDDTQSQLLDADGFLNVGNHRNKYQTSKDRLPLASMDENAMDANMDELLDLCSGKFKSQAEKPPLGHNTKKDMEELLNLCSGKFISQAGSSTPACSESSKQEKEPDTDDPMAEALALCSGSFPTDREEEDEEEEEEFGEFQLVADDSVFDNEEEETRESDEEDPEEEDPEEDDEEALLQQSETLKKQMRLKKFLEDEAEVSGSEVGSEDESEGEEMDEYEEEMIDEELPSEEELQDQINKIHMKTLLDDDKRQLRLYQERYLADGDLHSDGPGRTRKFRWKNIDDASQMDLFHHRDSDPEDQNEEQLDETEAKWRKERIEREQWLRDQAQQGKIEAEEEDEIGEESQFMMLAKKATVKALQKKVTPVAVVQETKALPRNPFEGIQPGRTPKLRTGSLLNQPKTVLQKLASMSDVNPNAPRSSRNFVFHTLSPVKSEAAAEPSKPQGKKRGPGAMATAPPKRVRDESPSVPSPQTRSIFRYLES
ncbi:claspin isoform X3 [Ornithorhynchus anatinus]|uniref:claspin isoform X3 n=1 Tax=Ornithorhynchus anatinus TaxID=9258 RepID=UPI0010A89F78|nr:claspin isoform X3 [Ornithorhynchus anatinus]